MQSLQICEAVFTPSASTLDKFRHTDASLQMSTLVRERKSRLQGIFSNKKSNHALLEDFNIITNVWTISMQNKQNVCVYIVF